MAAAIPAVLIAGLSYAPATAQESLERGAEVLRERDGPYLVSLHALPAKPKVGSINFTVTVESIARSTAVEHAAVVVTAIDPDGEPDWHSPAISFLENPTSYVGNGEFARPGAWRLEVHVSGEEGEALVQGVVNVLPLGRSNTLGGAIALAVSVSAAIGVGGWIALSIRRSQRRRAARD